ncbi:MAG: hypothetical protein Q8907_00045 [Bacteroidota bacterium]|nr:hypothetical protein [Bacteroidota bacterium]MDP4272652.1 hypothetical protein [Bacteroidota bacterium]
MKAIKMMLLSIILFLTNGRTALPQAGASVVYDPVNNAQLVKTTIMEGQTVANTSSMVTSLTTTITYLQKAEKLLKTINASLETAIWTKKVYQRQVDLIKEQYEISVKAQKLKSLSPEELKRLNDQLLIVVQGAEGIISTVKDILTPGKFSMGDADRIRELKDMDKRLSFQQTVMKIQYFEAKTTNEERESTRAYKMFN